MTLQAAVIPFRGAGKTLEICLIRRKEAGLKGRLVGGPVGSYEYEK